LLFVFCDAKVMGMDLIEHIKPHTGRYHNSQPRVHNAIAYR